MKLFGLLGYPVIHSYSAIMHNAAFEELGIDARYDLFEIDPNRLEEGFKEKLAAGVHGFNVTIPHKERIIPFLDEIDEEVRLIGAVNTIKVQDDGTTKGFNTDGHGFIMHLEEAIGFEPQGKNVSILGAGGAAKAISVQLAMSGAKTILIYDADEKKCEELKIRLKNNFIQCDVRQVKDANALLSSEKPDLLINATPVGMKNDDPFIFDAEYFHKKMIVYDLIYNPTQTSLLIEAKARGCAAFNGLGMLLYQGVLAFKLWMDVDAPVESMDRALRNVLTGAQ